MGEHRQRGVQTYDFSDDIGLDAYGVVEMKKRDRRKSGGNGDPDVAVGMRVRVYPGADTESGGVVVDDFGDSTGQAVDVGDIRIAEPARRWAVALDTGTLAFVGSEQLHPE